MRQIQPRYSLKHKGKTHSHLRKWYFSMNKTNGRPDLPIAPAVTLNPKELQDKGLDSFWEVFHNRAAESEAQQSQNRQQDVSPVCSITEELRWLN